jgi:uncharacterized protein
MVIGACKITLAIPMAASLKDKRTVVKGLLARVQQQFSISGAEVDDNDVINHAVLGFAVVSNSTAHANSMLDKVVDFIEQHQGSAELLDDDIEIIRVF